MAIRKLQNQDNLLAIENDNRILQEFIWSKYIEADVRIDKNIIIQNIPEFKFVYCTQSMIKQIHNAFVNDEVTFPQEPFIKYLQNLVNPSEILWEAKTIIHYKIFNTSGSMFGSFFSRSDKSTISDKSINRISNAIIKNRKYPSSL